MARSDVFTGLTEFLAVARYCSFRLAGAELGVSASAVSQAIRSLEARLKMPLFQRTTRNVAITEAGQALLGRLRPAAGEIALAVDAVSLLSGRTTGTLRLSVPRIALDTVILRVLPIFRSAHPEVVVEIEVDDASVDLAKGEFDAGIRIGEFVERDMVAVRLTSDFCWTVVASPVYLAARGAPKTPHDLVRHECLRYRLPTARTVYRWEFQSRGRAFSIDPPGRVVVNDHTAMVALAAAGVGLAYTADLVAAPRLASGELVSVLLPYLRARAGLFLYFPKGSQAQPKLRAFIDVATELLT